MGCGSSGQVIPAQDGDVANGHGKANGAKANGHKHDDDQDDLPTMVLPDSPIRPKPPIAFEIPLEELDSSRKPPASPPPHLQRLMLPPQPEITLPSIEEKLAEAEQRRQTILQQRAASAQKRAQKMMRTFNEMDKVNSEHETPDLEYGEGAKRPTHPLRIPPEPGLCDDKTI